MSEAFKINLSSAGVKQQLGLGNQKSHYKSFVEQNPEDKKSSFLEVLTEGLESVNAAQVQADKMTTNLASGKTENIHETMLAVSHAELSFKLMVQVRNKALEAYQEVMRMQV